MIWAKLRYIKVIAVVVFGLDLIEMPCYTLRSAGVAELVDAPDLGSGAFGVGVQVPSPAPQQTLGSESPPNTLNDNDIAGVSAPLISVVVNPLCKGQFQQFPTQGNSTPIVSGPCEECEDRFRFSFKLPAGSVDFSIYSRRTALAESEANSSSISG